MNDAMRKLLIILVVIIGSIIVILMAGPWYTLNETEICVITRFGETLRVETEAGMHWKFPGIEKVNILSKQILEWDGEARQFPTYDKRMILIDTTVKWKIKDPLKFFKNLTDEATAKMRLDDILDSTSRKVISQHSFEEIVRDTNRIKSLSAETIKLLKELGVTQEELDSYPAIEFGRNNLSMEMQREVVDKLDTMGIEVIGFFIMKVNYITENLQAVYESMIAERKKIAQSYRSQGEKYRQEKLGEMEQRATEILADAKKQAKEIRGNADAKATEIYNSAYNRSASTRDFYEFVKKMEMYKDMPGNSSFVITTEAEFFDMLKNY